ncbi:ABC transporter permease [Natrarchaeobius oligotrophus]|uniref:ABC transporter permease n=1 Tax=Natrarchaeobius chitinivorans TaxID=1679083 RepID=A0A3N6M0G1_NATCH|nr:ABC transporter permease [Natrarchaeobius chitinivorans]RQG95057.1 ABC transporter permease [Natrarchaeobius chitinivorans]
MAKTTYLVKRTGQTVLLLWLVITGLFFLFRLMPGDFTQIMLFQGADPETVAQFEEEWGLNDPLYVQYYRYMVNFVTLDAGMSVQYRVPVIEYVKMRIFNSVILIAPAITFAYLLGSIIGIIIGSNRGSKIEEYGIVPIILVGSVPSFVLGVFAIVIFSGQMNLFPSSGMYGVRDVDLTHWWSPYVTKDFVWHWTLPFIVIVMRYTFIPMLIMRTSVVETMGGDFIEYKKVAGVPKMQRMFSIAKHSSLPVITLYPITLTQAIGGLVLVEVVFNWPGIGAALVAAVFARDYPVIQFIFFLIAATIIIANFIVDIIYGMIDPRVSVEGNE